MNYFKARTYKMFRFIGFSLKSGEKIYRGINQYNEVSKEIYLLSEIIKMSETLEWNLNKMIKGE